MVATGSSSIGVALDATDGRRALAPGAPPGPATRPAAPHQGLLDLAAMLLGREPRASGARRRASQPRAAGRARCCAVVGEPGIGKTALLDDVADACARHARCCARAASSRRRTYRSAACSSCCAPSSACSTGCPTPQAAALGGALALRPGGARDRFAVGAATLSLLAAAAEARPAGRPRRRRALARRRERRGAAFAAAPAAGRPDRRRARGARGRAVAARRRGAARRCGSAGSTARRPRRSWRAGPRRQCRRGRWSACTAPRAATRSRCRSSPAMRRGSAGAPPETPLAVTATPRARVRRPRAARCPRPTRRLLLLAAAADGGDVATLARGRRPAGPRRRRAGACRGRRRRRDRRRRRWPSATR